MKDHWYFDCAPCKIAEPYELQDEAIRAAEDHVFTSHRDVPAHVRGPLRIGHVQNRSDNAFATAFVDIVGDLAPKGALVNSETIIDAALADAPQKTE